MNTAISAYVGGLPLGVSIAPYTEFPQAQTYTNNTLSGYGASLPPQRRRKLMQSSASQQATVSFLIAFPAGAPASAVADIQSAVASAIAPLTATISSVATGAGKHDDSAAVEQLEDWRLKPCCTMSRCSGPKGLPVAPQSCCAVGCYWVKTPPCRTKRDHNAICERGALSEQVFLAASPAQHQHRLWPARHSATPKVFCETVGRILCHISQLTCL